MKNITRKNLFTVLSISLLSLLFVSPAAAQGMGAFTRCVTQDGSEFYVARDVLNNSLGNFECKLRQDLGFVYLEPTDSTVPIFSLKREENGHTVYRLVTSGDVFTSLQTAKRGDWTPYPGDGIIGYVSFTKMPGTLGAYGFTQTNVKGDYERYRVEGKELDTWGAMKSVNFKNTPSFFIWKEKKSTASEQAFKNLQDITFRQVLFATGKNSETIGLKDKYGSPEKPLTLSCSDAVATSQTYCKFNIGITLTRNVAGTQQTFQVTADGGVNPIGNSGVFLKGQKTATMILPVSIKKAKSTLTVRISDLPPEQDKSRENNALTIKTFVTTN